MDLETMESTQLLSVPPSPTSSEEEKKNEDNEARLKQKMLDEPKHPRAKELRKRLMNRRADREKALGLAAPEPNPGAVSKDDEQYLPFILAQQGHKPKSKVNQKRLAAEKNAHGLMLLTLADYNISDRQYLSSVDKQFSVGRTLSLFENEVSVIAGRSKEKIDSISQFEKRLIKLKQVVADGPTTNHDADKEVDNMLRGPFSKDIRGEFKSCSKCGERFVKHLLLKHVVYCQGGANGQDTEKADDGKTTKTTASGNVAEVGPDEEVFCQLCGKKFTGKTISKHTSKCEERAKFLESKEGQESALISLLPPQKPRNIEVKLVGPDFIQLVWEPPILDGGCKVFDYELTYKHCVVETIGKQKIRHLTDMPPLLCSRWSMRPPVATYGFTMTDLAQDTEYSDIQVRCRNKIDWGGFSKPIEPVFTLNAIPPSPPLFFENVKLTNSIIAFKWGSPMSHHGSPIVDYELTYTEVVAKENQGVGLKKESDKFEEVVHVAKIGGDHTYHSFLDLRGDGEFKNWELRAINAVGQLSEPVMHGMLKTKKPTRRQLVQKEIERCRKVGGEYIDTDFYSGFVQREEVLDYLTRLEDELATLPQDADHLAFLMGTGAGKKKWTKLKIGHAMGRGVGVHGADREVAKAAEEAAIELLMPGYIRRKDQFDFRIKDVEDEIVELQRLKEEAVSNRSFLTYQMGHMQERIILLQGEMDRVITFKGEALNSSVIHGTDQRFTVHQLKTDLTVELENAQGSIAAWKQEVIHGDRMKMKYAEQKIKKIEHLKGRQAAYADFMNQGRRTQKFSKANGPGNPKEMKQKMLLAWKENVATIIRVRGIMMKVWGGQSLRFMRSAWVKWVYGKHAGGSGIGDKYNIVGAGGTLLVSSELGRMDNVKEMAAVLVSLTEIDKQSKLSHYTNEQRLELEKNPNFLESELGHSLGHYERDLALMIQGDAFYNIRKYDGAMNCYESQLDQMREEDDPNEPDVKVLAMLFGRKGRIELARRAWDRAILNYDRQRSLADEIESDVEWASAYMGLGEGYLGKGDYDNSRVLFEQAMLKCMVITDRVRQAKAYRGVQVSYERLYNPLYAARFKEKADALTNANGNRITSAFGSLDDLKARLIDTTASMGETIELERISPGCISMRAERIKLQERIELQNEKLAEATKQVDQTKELLQKIIDQLQEARTTDKDEMNSALVHEKEQVFEIEELKMRLAERQKKVEVDVEDKNRFFRKIRQTGLNYEDDLDGLDKDLAVEQGALMKQVVKRKILRAIGLNPSNTAGNEVTGTATGGIEFVAAVDTNNVNLYDIHTGTLKLVFSGDEEGRHVGETLGHTSVITCILFHDTKIYTGSMDTTVMCWDIESEEREWVGNGHEATVTCLYVDMYKLISGAADTKIIIWNKFNGQMVKLVHGHSRGVSCIHSGPTWFCSGGAEGEIRVWSNLHPDEDPKYKSIKCQTRLKGHGCKVTVVKYGKLELISGDANGTIIVWWLKTGDIVQRCKAHTGVITDLQFDATKIVTSGVDHNLQLIDITTGEILQTLRGHEGPVVGLAFDSTKVVSASSDGTIKHWEWGSASDKPDKLHIYDSGDNLAKISRKYKVSIPELVKWNGIKDVKKMYVGQKLIVAKGNPDEPTEQELAALTSKSKDTVREANADLKIKAALAKAEQDLREANHTDIGSDLLATCDDHLDKANLNNRILAGEHALLPEEYMDVDKEREAAEKKHSDFTSLGARIGHNGKTKEDLHVKGDAKKGWEDEVKKNEYDPANDPEAKKRIADQMGMFLLYKVVDQIVADVIKEGMSTDTFEESLSGRLYNYDKGKKPVYKASRRFSNALDFAKVEDLIKLRQGAGKGDADASLGSMKSISRASADSDTVSSGRSRGSMLSRMKEWESPNLSHHVRKIDEGDEDEDSEGEGEGGEKKKKKKKHKKKKKKEKKEHAGGMVDEISEMSHMDDSLESLGSLEKVAEGGGGGGVGAGERGGFRVSQYVTQQSSPANSRASPDLAAMSIGDEYRQKFKSKEEEQAARAREKEREGGASSVVSELSEGGA